MNILFLIRKIFFFYLITGGMPKYIDHFLNEQIKNRKDMFNVMLQKDSLFLNEGKNLLIEEFGRDYLTYFSILELIAEGKTARSAIESLL